MTLLPIHFSITMLPSIYHLLHLYPGMSSAAIRGTARVTGVKRLANFAHTHNSNLKGDTTVVYASFNGNIPSNNSNGCQTTQQQSLNSSCELPGTKKLRSNAAVTSVMGVTMPNNNGTRSSSWR